MTSGEHLNNRTGDTADWLSVSRAAMNTIVAALGEAPFAGAIEAIDQYRSVLNATEALLIAQRTDAGFSEHSTQGVIKQSGGVSKVEAKKRTSRAAVIKQNPELASKLVDGAMSTEQVDLVADASAKTDGLAATDDELIADLASTNPDLGVAIAKKFVEDHTTAADRNSRYEYQRARRKVRKGRGTNGLAYLLIEGDDESIDVMYRSFKRGADRLYRADGGRDVPNGKHPRTNDQRMFDAAVQKLTSETEPAPAAPATQPASAEDNTQPTLSQPQRRPGERPTMVFTGKLTDITNDPALLAEWEAELVGTGKVPSAVSSYYRCISEYAGQLLDENGEVLWHGRGKRLATPEQWTAMVVRDRGCVRCGADAHECEAHHIIPYKSPAEGETNIDEMVMLCVGCHHWIHNAKMTIYWDPTAGKWKYRPARWEELPPKPPPKQAKPNQSRSKGPTRQERPQADTPATRSTSPPTARSQQANARNNQSNNMVDQPRLL